MPIVPVVMMYVRTSFAPGARLQISSRKIISLLNNCIDINPLIMGAYYIISTCNYYYYYISHGGYAHEIFIVIIMHHYYHYIRHGGCIHEIVTVISESCMEGISIYTHITLNVMITFYYYLSHEVYLHEIIVVIIIYLTRSVFT